jgi:hypothetical protein
MKQIFFLVVLNVFSTTSFGQTLSECKKFETDVLVKAVIPDTDPSQFINDEKKALAFIGQYDVKKLLLPEVRNTMRESRKEFIANNCQATSKKPLPFCQSFSFSNFIFIQGLTSGMKNYGWKPDTIRLGKQKVWDYMQAVSNEEGVSTLSLMMSVSNFIELVDAKLITGVNSKSLKDMLAEMERESEVYSKAIAAEKDPKKQCDIDKKYSNYEESFMRKYNPKFRVLLSQWKKP